MRIHEVCGQCGLTRKAVEYYERQGLLLPASDENGYRNYSDGDAQVLTQISALRKLGLSVADIKAVLFGADRIAVLNKCRKRLVQDIRKSSDRLDCLEYLCRKPDDIDGAALLIARKLDGGASIADRLALAFPGAFGKLLRCHFGRFLSGTPDTTEKAAAYDAAVAYLDGLEDAEFPADLETLLDDALRLQDDAIRGLDDGMVAGVADFDGFMRDNREAIERYLEYRRSQEYLASPAHRMKELLKTYFSNSGYYHVFIPNMKILSDSYREYSEKLEAANAKFLLQYPDAADALGQ